MKFLTGILKFILSTLISVAIFLTFLAGTSLEFLGLSDSTALDAIVGLINGASSGGDAHIDENSAPTKESFADVKEQIGNDSFSYADLLNGPVYFSSAKRLSFTDSALASLLNLAIGKDEHSVGLSAEDEGSVMPLKADAPNTIQPLAASSVPSEINYHIDSFTTEVKDGKYYIKTALTLNIPESLIAEVAPEGAIGDMVKDLASGDICLGVKTRVDITDRQLVLTSDEVSVDADFVVKALIVSAIGDDAALNEFLNAQAIAIINNLGFVDASSFGTGTTNIDVRVIY